MPQLIPRSLAVVALAFSLLFACRTIASAQSVQPLISEYTDHAEGWFEVTNGSLAASVVVLEPKSFSILPDGTGDFRPLDSTIHLELSVSSIRLEPHQTARVFYKVTADRTPVWLCIYSSFLPAKRSPGLTVRIMLPHTIYVYQHQPLPKEAIDSGRAWYDAVKHLVHLELTNNSSLAGRAQSVEVDGPHAFNTAGGFPMLPYTERTLSVDWTAEQPPHTIEVVFERFSLKYPIELSKE